MSDEFDFDFGGVASAGTPLPEGEYVFVIEDATVKPSKDGNSKNLVLTLTVQEPVELNGRSNREQINLQESTLPFVKAFFTKLLGLSDEDIESEQINHLLRNPEEMVSETIGGFVTHTVSTRGEQQVTYANVTSWFTA